MLPVAVVIPIYKEDLTPYELISLQQCYSVLGNYPILFVCPKRMKIGKFHQSQKSKGQFVFLDDVNFNTITTYNHMLLSVWFYELFINYKYILIYQLDCFVFTDKLMAWVDKGYSYIGAPWVRKDLNIDNNIEFMGVGNGGFSLRNVNDCITVLNSSKKIINLKDCIKRHDSLQKPFKTLRGIKLHYKIDTFNKTYKNTTINEDKVFELAAARFNFFIIPKPEEALSFSFEEQPKKLYEMNNNELPFGCHAWWKYDLQFYKLIFKQYEHIVNEEL